ncbi:hypothetical protein [Pimelobacter simplex]|uniref:hypothetical protein n=1 Tax=Nocardioides simplex TaxID=2045 RepID=UPI001933D1E2|nr:hypothetical protein [Pimelobacter simplex]
MELVAGDKSLTELAEEVVGSLGAIHKGASKTEMEERAESTRTLVEVFVTTAANQVSAELRASRAVQ